MHFYLNNPNQGPNCRHEGPNCTKNIFFWSLWGSFGQNFENKWPSFWPHGTCPRVHLAPNLDSATKIAIETGLRLKIDHNMVAVLTNMPTGHFQSVPFLQNKIVVFGSLCIARVSRCFKVIIAKVSPAECILANLLLILSLCFSSLMLKLSSRRRGEPLLSITSFPFGPKSLTKG